MICLDKRAMILINSEAGSEVEHWPITTMVRLYRQRLKIIKLKVKDILAHVHWKAIYHLMPNDLTTNGRKL